MSAMSAVHGRVIRSMMARVTLRTFVFALALLSVGLACRGRWQPEFPSNFATVRLTASRIVAADGTPYTGTLVARAAEIAAVARVVMAGSPFVRTLSASQLGGLVLVLPVRAGVAEGRATMRVDLASPKLDRELVRRIQLPQFARELAGTAVIGEATFAGGTLEGPAVVFGARGRPELEGRFRGGVLHGRAREYFPGTTQVRRELGFDAGVRSGRAHAFYANGALEREANYAGGELDGEVVEYYANHQVRSRGTYHRGERVGTHRAWFPTGQPEQQVVFGEPPQVTEWYSNGQLKRTSGPDGQVEHPADGVIEDFHHGGALRSRAHYADGQLHGAFERFYADGTPWEVAEYAHGRQVGAHRTWWKNQQLALDETFVDGALHGTSKHWYANGTLWESATYEAGTRVGRYQKWWKNGALAHDYTYTQGKLDGDGRQFYASGAKWVEARYRNDKPVGTLQRWFPDGRLGYTVQHNTKGRPEGPVRRWYANGKPRLEAMYVDGQFDGQFKNWLADGTVYELATYRRGVKVQTTRPAPPAKRP